MMVETILSRSVRLVCAGGMAFSLTAAYAQEAPMQKVEVTGSRIPSLNTEGSSPVTVLGAKDIKIDGARNTEDLLNNLPQVFASQGAAISNGASGTATVDLRGMGSQRTLVLVNGKRLPAGSVLNSAADLNQIPSQLIKHVDVLTGGAGAVYGSGAVAGVVNFIMKDHYEGVEVELNGSGANHQQHNPTAAVVAAKPYPLPGNNSLDAKKYDMSILMGSDFADGKGNATMFVAYKHADALLQSQRDFSACSFGATKTGLACSGSGTSLQRVGIGSTSYTPDASGNPRAYTAADAYNFGPLNFFQRPSDEYSINSTMHYDLNDKARIYNEFNFHNYTTDAQIAPGGIFYGQQATLSYDNPLLNAAWRTALGLLKPGDTVTATVGKRNTEGGPRNSHISDTSFREVFGVKGDIGDWSYDVFAQFGRVDHQDRSSGYFSTRLIAKALDVVPDANGKPVCRSFLDGSDKNCVPYNLYTQGGITPAVLNYLQASGSNTGFTQQSVFGFNLGTDLGSKGIKMPHASNGVGISVGYEQRVEKLVFSPDYENMTGDLSGSGGVTAPVSGSYNVKEAFGEVKIPLVDKAFLAEHLDLSGSYRRSDYSTGKNTNTYGFGVDWAPLKTLRVRSSLQRAVRAPNIFELYTPQAVGLGSINSDPCSGAKPTASAAACANTGLPANLYGNVAQNSTSQYNGRFGGNPNVNPETADTVTLGLVLDPIKDLTITIDAFRLKIKNAIATANAQSVFTQCLNTGASAYCSMIHRDSLGSLWLLPTGYVDAGTTNIGSQSTSGIDLGSSYHMRLAALGSLDFSLTGTYLKTFSFENLPGKGEYNCAGYFGPTCGLPSPKWRHKVRSTWSTPWNFDVSGTWRYIAKVSNDTTSSDPLLAGTLPTPADAYLSSRSYFDLNAVYRFSKKIAISAGINNLFDKDPPIASSSSMVGSFANGNTYPQVYDAYGRFIYANLTYKF
jgi:outer membrane receptor protein involved in Fe transport